MHNALKKNVIYQNFYGKYIFVVFRMFVTILSSSLAMWKNIVQHRHSSASCLTCFLRHSKDLMLIKVLLQCSLQILFTLSTQDSQHATDHVACEPYLFRGECFYIIKSITAAENMPLSSESNGNSYWLRCRLTTADDVYVHRFLNLILVWIIFRTVYIRFLIICMHVCRS